MQTEVRSRPSRTRPMSIISLHVAVTFSVHRQIAVPICAPGESKASKRAVEVRPILDHRNCSSPRLCRPKPSHASAQRHFWCNPEDAFGPKSLTEDKVPQQDPSKTPQEYPREPTA